MKFRDIVEDHKNAYLAGTVRKLEKAHIAAKIVQQIRTTNPPGRFLKLDPDTGYWADIGDERAIKKTLQALREDGPDLRPDVVVEERREPTAIRTTEATDQQAGIAIDYVPVETFDKERDEPSTQEADEAND